MSIGSLLYTSRDSLLAHQMALDIVGANIANVDTPGYSRQRVDLKSTGNITVGGSNAQIGVTVNAVDRIYDRYLDSQITEQQQNMGYSDTMLQSLQNMEVMIDDTNGGGINDQLNKFWASWEDLSKNPGGIVERTALVATAENLTGSFAAYRQNLETINTDLNRSIADVVSQINDKVSEITDLNAKIITIPGDKGDRNILLDKRSQALKELSGLIDITQVETADGSVSVFMSNGEPLLQGNLGQTLSVRQNTSGRSDILSSNSPGQPIQEAIKGGKLGAFVELQNSILPEYVTAIDATAKALADRVNELHRNGFDTYQNTGADFFEIANSTNMAGTIQVSSAIRSDANRIAAAASVTGDAENATKIAAVQNELLMNSNTSSLNSFLASLVGKIGNQVSSAKTDSDHQTIIANQLINQRESVSGVSLDEEMIRLIKYQMGYTAAGKLCTTVNEMLETLMNLVK